MTFLIGMKATIKPNNVLPQQVQNRHNLFLLETPAQHILCFRHEKRPPRLREMGALNHPEITKLASYDVEID